MHDPMTVAFEIPSPVPRRRMSSKNDWRRWGVRVSRRTNDENLGERTYPWWRLRGYTLFAAGHRYGLGTLVTVWHVEPDGHDSGEVCKHYRHEQRPDGTWETTVLHGWRWHVHHWHLQFPPLQALRRTLLTRCAWCGGRSRKGDAVNFSHSWDGPRGRWWQGAPGLFHRDCSSAETAANACVCDHPVLDHAGYGRCARCMGFRAYGVSDGQIGRSRLLRTLRRGERPSPELMAQVRESAQRERSSP